MKDKEFDNWFDEMISEKGLVYHLEEMANLPIEKTGLKNTCVYFSNKEHSSGPRVKIYFEGNCGKGRNFSLSIDDKPKLIDTTNASLYLKKANRKDIKKVLLMIITFKEDLLLLWNYPEKIKDSGDLKDNILYWFNTNIKKKLELIKE